MVEILSQKDLEKYLWDAAILLRGKIDSSDYREYIFPLLFFKRLCDVYDEEFEWEMSRYGESFPENHRFQIPANAHWNEVRSKTKNVGLAIQTAMREIELANQRQLEGIFGDARWANRERLSDADLRDLIEHLSAQTLSLERVPQDELGQGYETLIKWFADDAGHTAAEFYTNRTLVKLMTMLLEPSEGESILDPTCGSGGMLLTAALQLKEEGKNYRSLKLYGQDVNYITTAIARMNLFLHGIEDFNIVRDDVLLHPAFLENDNLKTFNLVLANPPYSIKKWNWKAFKNDPYGRNILGSPPQSRADYAFFQHIIKSLDPTKGRCAILFPHGVLFREDERLMRENLVKMDIVECVLGLAPNLFYGSPMKACVVVCRVNKPDERVGNVLFIDASNEFRKERTQSFLEPEHRNKILAAYHSFEDVTGFSRVVSNSQILANDASLKINSYIASASTVEPTIPVEKTIYTWERASFELHAAIDDLISQITKMGPFN